MRIQKRQYLLGILSGKLFLSIGQVSICKIVMGVARIICQFPGRKCQSGSDSYFLRLRGEGGGNGRDQAVPSLGFLAETLAPFRREFVKLRPPIVL